MALISTVLLVHRVFGLTTEFAVRKFHPVPLTPYSSCSLGGYISLAHLLYQLRISITPAIAPAPHSIPCFVFPSSQSLTSIPCSRTSYLYRCTTFTISLLSARTYILSYSCRYHSALKPGRYVQMIPRQLIFITQSATTTALLSGLPHINGNAPSSFRSSSCDSPSYSTSLLPTTSFWYCHKQFILVRHTD